MEKKENSGIWDVFLYVFFKTYPIKASLLSIGIVCLALGILLYFAQPEAYLKAKIMEIGFWMGAAGAAALLLAVWGFFPTFTTWAIGAGAVYYFWPYITDQLLLVIIIGLLLVIIKLLYVGFNELLKKK